MTPFALLAGLALGAAPPAPAVRPEPHLPPNEAALAALSALKPNHAVALGPAAVVGDFNDTARRFDLHKNGPRGRDFSIKMAWAADRNRALFCGANHAVPHRINDVWEFDLGALAWAMLYAPDNPRDYLGLGKDASDVLFKDGTFVTKRGGPGIIAHTWWGLTYDPDHKALLFLNTWVTERAKAAVQLGGDPAALDPGPPLWAFTPADRAWKPLKAARPYPTAIFGGMLEYVPGRGTLWHANNWQTRGTWAFDFQAGTWADLKANGGGKAFEDAAPGPEQVGYYDPKRKLVVVHRHYDTFHFDPKTAAWTKVRTGDKADGRTPYGHDAFSPMYHDAASGHGLLIEFKTNALWAYDPDAGAWTKLAPEGAAMPTGNKRLAYADPAHNAFVVIDGTSVWAYRYKAK